MNVAIQVPIKARSSTRVPNKNFRDLAGKPLAHWLLDELLAHCPPEWDLFIDSENASVMENLTHRHRERFAFHQREPWFAEDHANGNHLAQQFALAQPSYDIYGQLYVTAITLPGQVVEEAIHALTTSINEYDSLVLVTHETGWFWREGRAVNYEPDRPSGLPRSQDAMLMKETTGLYAVTRDALYRHGCRIGKRPRFFVVPREQAYDVDTMEDFREAEKFLLARQRGELPK